MTATKSNRQLKRELLTSTIEAIKEMLKGFIASIKVAPKTGSCYIRVNTKDGLKKVRIADHPSNNTKDLDLNLYVNIKRKGIKKICLKTLQNSFTFA